MELASNILLCIKNSLDARLKATYFLYLYSAKKALLIRYAYAKVYQFLLNVESSRMKFMVYRGIP